MRIVGLAIGGVFILLVTIAAAVKWTGPNSRETGRGTIDFNEDIRPILTKNCTGCHGGVKQDGGVSFIYRELVLGKGKSGRPTVVPGNPDASELIARVTSDEPDYRMPFHRPPLEEAQIQKLKQWIKEGAPWEDYWAFVPPKEQSLPEVQDKDWAKQKLDHFVLARLESESLSPSPEASKTELLRRVSFDLTGLPPTPEEISNFLNDLSDDAYEKQVDRLLASPQFGERWASVWLDLARYGDSKGLVTDMKRPGAWVYRDWVIKAVNENVPYDEFVIKQLAGDLLPNAEMEDIIATAFHRNTLANDEGGTDNEEFRVAATMDRVATTWSVLNGMTMNCVQCHSHPYDPIRHTDYYTSLAFFNTSSDADLAWFNSILEPIDDWPVLRVPTDSAKKSEAWRIQNEAAELRSKVAESSRALKESVEDWAVAEVKSAILDEKKGLEQGLEKLEKYMASAPEDDGLRQWAYNDTVKKFREKLAANEFYQGEFEVVDGVAETPETAPPNAVYALTLEPARPVVTAFLIEVPASDPEAALHTPERGFLIERVNVWVSSPDGSRKKVNLRFLAPDTPASLESSVAQVLKNAPETGDDLSSSQAMRRLAQYSVLDSFTGHFRDRWIVAATDEPLELAPNAEVTIELTNLAATISSTPAVIPRIRVQTSGDERWTKFANGENLSSDVKKLESLGRRLSQIESVPLPIMRDRPRYASRDTLTFGRGNFLNKVGSPLDPDVPAIFPPIEEGADSRNRLTLAKWFFVPEQPLTARVAVNRYWQQLFGSGIVETLGDFGSIGDRPSHPKLLDWLALHFQNDLQWDRKALLREIVTSATYRQSAVFTPLMKEKDPRNRLLSRGPKQRLTAEMVRDQALVASGLINNEIGGAPVMPPQPEGVWSGRATFGGASWQDAQGPDRYRRAIYTFLKRSSVYPSYMMFDMSDHQETLARRISTNTPLQALVTLNDVVYREAAEALAIRMQNAISTNDVEDPFDARANYGALCVISRNLTPPELDALRELYQTLLDDGDGDDHKAMVEVASVLLNLDAALTR